MLHSCYVNPIQFIGFGERKLETHNSDFNHLFYNLQFCSLLSYYSSTVCATILPIIHDMPLEQRDNPADWISHFSLWISYFIFVETGKQG